MVTSFGLDISHHQGASLDLNKCREEGISFLFIKSTEGSKFVDSLFKVNLAKGRQAKLLTAAYHYVRSDASAASQVENIAKVVPKDVAVIPDVEANSGGVALVRELVDKLEKAGYKVPLLYLPRWYWQQIGSPSLVGLPPLWSSRYPDRVVGTIADEYADVPATYWNGYGGLPVEVLQFTSSAKVAGYQPLDANAYRGTVEQLSSVLGAENMALKDESWTVTDYDNNKTFPVDALTMLGNLYQREFYGSRTPPWDGPSATAMLKDLVSRSSVDIDEEVLVQKMHDLGIGGVTVDQMRELLSNLTFKTIS